MRTMVRAGTVKVGDTIEGRIVTGLGTSWVVDDEYNCEWGAEPGERVRVQYAYFDGPPVRTRQEAPVPTLTEKDRRAIKREEEKAAWKAKPRRQQLEEQIAANEGGLRFVSAADRPTYERVIATLRAELESLGPQ